MKATHVVHWPSGPVNACEEHARQLVGLGQFMGAHVICTPCLEDDAECGNCKNEKKTEGSSHE